MWHLWFKIKQRVIRQRKCCQTRRIFGANSLCEHMAPHICEQDIGFCYKQKTPKVVNNGRGTWEPLSKIVSLDSKTNIKKFVGVPSCYFAHVRLRWEQSRKLRLTHNVFF